MRGSVLEVVACVALVSSSCDDGDTGSSSRTEPNDVVASRNALQGGTTLSSNEIMRSGAVEIRGGACTGTVLYTSAFERRTWVITAAHCVCDISTSTTVSLSRAGSSLGPASGTVFLYPGYSTDPSCGAEAHDLALVRYPFGVTLEAPDGHIISEFSRPIRSNSPYQGFSARAFGLLGAGVTTGQAGTSPCTTGTDDSTTRWAASGFAEIGDGSGTIYNISLFSPAGSFVRPGDSGGGWFITTSAPVTVSATIDEGVVGGTTSTATLCSTSNQYATAASTWYSAHFSFLSTTMGSDLFYLSSDWSRTCYDNWCHYSESQKAALILAASL